MVRVVETKSLPGNVREGLEGWSGSDYTSYDDLLESMIAPGQKPTGSPILTDDIPVRPTKVRKEDKAKKLRAYLKQLREGKS